MMSFIDTVAVMTTLFLPTVHAAEYGSVRLESTQPIVIEKTVSLGIDQAWRKWIDPDDLTKWLAPRANVEPKIGGLFELFWDLDHPDQNSTIGCRILELKPNEQIAFQWKGPVPFADIMNTEPIPTWVRVSFYSMGTNRTAIRLEHFGWQTGARWDAAKVWQKQAWLQALSQL